ncbi:hypothetical protein JHK84_047673 [Glycine max]|nr:hypothetical protein JHK86_047647 [Glycine max]KAG4943618.1 hypothetical protein JHK85_048264 [Glycine max]KAG5102704.1 hypothetical protein JHK84_047673 [Glycine max]
MEDKIETADKKVLVDIVKLAQKRGLKGNLGGWKEFLNSHDKKFGAGLSDPSKRSHEVLAAFLKTFSKEEDLKFFDNIMRHHSNQYMLERLKDKSHDSPEQGWIVVNFKNKPKVMKSTEMVAVDCEMVLCEDGTEAVVKVCVVDHNLEVKLDKLVKPDKEIADYRTEITGVSSQDLEAVTCSLADIQAVLHHEVREKGAPHNCLDDAKAAMDLVLAKIKHGVDKEFPIALVQEHVPESELAKLLLHKIPNTVNIETLHKILPGNFKIELKPSRKGQGANYSAFAIFRSPPEADGAYENVQGSQLKDTYGHPQKLVTFRLSTGLSVNLFVRKMVTEEPNDQTPSKRALQINEAVDVSKKAKMDPKIEEDASAGFGKGDTDAHSKEIEALNQQLKQSEMVIESLRKQLTQKDFEISMLHKMISSKKKKKQTV